MIDLFKLPNKKQLDLLCEDYNQIYIKIEDKKHLISVIEYFNNLGYVSNYQGWKHLIIKDNSLEKLRSINNNSLHKIYYVNINLEEKRLETNIGVKVEFSDSDYLSLANKKIINIKAKKSDYLKTNVRKKLNILK